MPFTMGFRCEIVIMQKNTAAFIESDCEAAQAKRRRLGEISEETTSQSAAIALMSLKKQSRCAHPSLANVIDNDVSRPRLPWTPLVVSGEYPGLVTFSGEDSLDGNPIDGVSKKRRNFVRRDHHDGLTKNAWIQPSICLAPPAKDLSNTKETQEFVVCGGLPRGRPLPPAPRLPSRLMPAPLRSKTTMGDKDRKSQVAG